MTRCSSCNGIIAPSDVCCYVCGEAIPGRKKRTQRNRGAKNETRAETRSTAVPVQLTCFASLVVATWALVNGHRFVLYVGLTLCSVLLFGRIFAANKQPKQQKS